MSASSHARSSSSSEIWETGSSWRRWILQRRPRWLRRTSLAFSSASCATYRGTTGTPRRPLSRTSSSVRSGLVPRAPSTARTMRSRRHRASCERCSGRRIPTALIRRVSGRRSLSPASALLVNARGEPGVGRGGQSRTGLRGCDRPADPVRALDRRADREGPSGRGCRARRAGSRDRLDLPRLVRAACPGGADRPGGRGSDLVRHNLDTPPREGMALRAAHGLLDRPTSARRTSRTPPSSTASSGTSGSQRPIRRPSLPPSGATFEGLLGGRRTFEPYEPGAFRTGRRSASAPKRMTNSRPFDPRLRPTRTKRGVLDRSTPSALHAAGKQLGRCGHRHRQDRRRRP